MQLSLTDRRHCEGVSADAQVSPCHRRVSCQSPGDKADQPRVQVPSCVTAHHLTMLLLVLLGLAALCQVPSPAAASRLGDNIAMFEGAAVEDTAEVAAVEDTAEGAAVEDTADFHVDATNETEFAFLLEHNDQLFDPSLLVPLKRSVPLITISDVKEIVPDQDGNNITHVEGIGKKV